ncbi:NAD(P)H-binding protein [Geomonas propionica]|uniref:NAD(P)H-binding protein n=1 Tax=Geomonas propionica TaxID=2798582 RepID=A0ABS0YVS7_9BACT|nr:NAD(P)H-binding protein [Geomonas propionica]MBJ6802079.1 NAD(P)H-binding protein [Geomonas propionica]
MRVLVFGATGMVGQGVLRECLAAPDVSQVMVVGRTSVEQVHPKLQELLLADLMTLHQHEKELQGFDACFFCLGGSSSGMSEEAYRRLTYDLTLDVASLLARLTPSMTFVYVSGAGADRSERGPSMWARVRGQTENALFRLPFAQVYSIRPAIIQPLHGIRSKTLSYRMLYQVLSPLFPLVRWLAPRMVLSTELMGQAMLELARKGADIHVLEARDIHRMGKRQG